MSEVEARGPEAGAPEGGATSAASGVDLGRRRFFRQFATDIFQTAATVAGAATALQRSTAEAAGAILNPEAATMPPALEMPLTPPVSAGIGEAGPRRPGARPVVAQPTGFRSAFRVDEQLLFLVDQRRLPGELAEIEVRSAVELAGRLRESAMCPGPAAGHAAAVAMALTASKSRSARAYGRRAIMRAGATQLTSARPTSRYVAAAVERVMAVYEEIGELSEDGDAIAGAVWAEADAILSEATGDLGRIGRHGILLLANDAAGNAEGNAQGTATTRPVGILVRGAIGPLAGGQVGTVMAVLRAATAAGRDILVHVAETRPNLIGARVGAWELEQAGIPHVVVADGAAGWLLEAGRIDLVLVGAERIAANGDVAGEIGTYPLAALAHRHGVPFGVCAPLAAVDFTAADGRAMPIEQGPAHEVARFAGALVTPPGSAVLNPVTDVTTHDLVTAIVTEEGLVRAPYGSGIVEAWRARTVRHGVPRVGGPPEPEGAPGAAPDGGAPADARGEAHAEAPAGPPLRAAR